MPTKSNSQTVTSGGEPPAAGQAAHTPNAFDRFYSAPSPFAALELAVSDAIHAKMPGEFVTELMAARDAFSAMVNALHEARPYLKASADANAQSGWVTRSGAVLHMIDTALNRAALAQAKQD